MNSREQSKVTPKTPSPEGSGPVQGRGILLGGALVCGVLGVALIVSAGLLAPDPVSAQQVGVNEPVINSVSDLEPVNCLDAKLPMDLTFVDETGATVPLTKYFEGDKPVILNLAYFSCPMLCNLVVEGLMEVVDEVDWTMGKEFTVLTVSIDPRDKPSTALARKEVLLEELGRDDAITGWHFLTGREKDLRQFADTVGFRYKWDDVREEYAHAAVLIVITPDGRVARYLNGIKFDPKVFRLSMVEAADGKVGSTMDKLFLLCFHYDPTTATYGVKMAWVMMRVGGAMTLFAFAIGAVWLSHSRRRKLAVHTTASET